MIVFAFKFENTFVPTGRWFPKLKKITVCMYLHSLTGSPKCTLLLYWPYWIWGMWYLLYCRAVQTACFTFVWDRFWLMLSFSTHIRTNHIFFIIIIKVDNYLPCLPVEQSRVIKFGIQIWSYWPPMGQIWYFLRSVSLHFGSGNWS